MTLKKGHKINVGREPWNKGLTKETDDRVKKYGENGSKTKKKLFKEGKLIPMRSMLGKHHSEETRRKMSESGGNRKGKSHTEEAKEKLKLKHKGNHYSPSTEFKKGLIPWSNGLTKETDERVMKIAQKRAKQILPTKDTKIEVKIQNFLKTLGIEFFTHQYMKIEHGYQCDILIPYLNLVIECDGDFIHCNPEKYSPNFVRFPNSKCNQPAYVIWERDRLRTEELIEKGFKVLRLWEFEIKEMSIDTFQNKLMEVKNGNK